MSYIPKVGDTVRVVAFHKEDAFYGQDHSGHIGKVSHVCDKHPHPGFFSLTIIPQQRCYYAVAVELVEAASHPEES